VLAGLTTFSTPAGAAAWQGIPVCSNGDANAYPSGIDRTPDRTNYQGVEFDQALFGVQCLLEAGPPVCWPSIAAGADVNDQAAEDGAASPGPRPSLTCPASPVNCPWRRGDNATACYRKSIDITAAATLDTTDYRIFGP
jgi:hypothetical protein